MGGPIQVIKLIYVFVEKICPLKRREFLHINRYVTVVNPFSVSASLWHKSANC